MQEDLIIIAKRESAQKNITGALSTFCLFSVFLIFDIIFYIRDKYTWELVLLIISAILDGFALLALLFAWSNYGYAKRILDKPLILFDSNKNVFLVNDSIFHKDVEVLKDDVIEVRISDNGETYLWYKKESKKTSMFIGYSTKESQDLINNELQKYKNFY